VEEIVDNNFNCTVEEFRKYAAEFIALIETCDDYEQVENAFKQLTIFYLNCIIPENDTEDDLEQIAYIIKFCGKKSYDRQCELIFRKLNNIGEIMHKEFPYVN
jgi:hypothetical protein